MILTKCLITRFPDYDDHRPHGVEHHIRDDFVDTEDIDKRADTEYLREPDGPNSKTS